MRCDPSPPPAVVVGMDDLRGVYAARTLARHGVDVIGVATSPRSYGARTRACRRIITADTDGAGLIDALIGLGSELPTRAVIVPCTDQSVKVLSSNRRRLEKWYDVALPTHQAVETLTDKARFYRYCEQNGLPIPRTRILAHRSDAQRAADELEFPCVVKPSDSRSRRWVARTTHKAFRVETAEELVEIYELYRSYAESLIVQEWIEGPDDSHYNCNVWFDRNGEPRITFVSRKLRQWPPSIGDGSLNVEYRAEDLAAMTRAVFSGFEHRGLAELEFKRDETTGRMLIIEPNVSRVTGRCALAEGSGVPLLYTAYCDLAGLPLPAHRGQPYRGTKWVFIRRDLLSAFHLWRSGNLAPRQWLRTLRGPKVYALLSLTDPGPFLADIGRSARLALRPGEMRRRLRS